MRKTGIYVNFGSLQHFIPNSLPPSDPFLVLNEEQVKLLDQASFHLGRLNAICGKLPDFKRFVRAYVIKEALLSSAIESIHTTLIDLFTTSLPDAKLNKNTALVLNYVQAIDNTWQMMAQQGLPIASRVILAAHQVLMGEDASPGQYRKQSVKVGNLVPPPAPQIPELMADLERYINQDHQLPAIIKAGLVHLQFETIHPFLDGNGRIGRLLIVLMLMDADLLQAPILYPSYYFKKHHLEYYQRLDAVRTHGDFEGWTTFYLKAICESSLDAYLRAKDIESLEAELAKLIFSQALFFKNKETAILALNVIFRMPVISVKELALQIGKAYNTANQLIQQFVELKILSESSGQKRFKLYRFEPYLQLLEKEY